MLTPGCVDIMGLHRDDRVRLRQNVELFDAFWAEKDSLGTVTFVDEVEGYVGIRLDIPVDGLEPWDNELIFNRDNANVSANADLQVCCAGYKLEESVEILAG